MNRLAITEHKPSWDVNPNCRLWSHTMYSKYKGCWADTDSKPDEVIDRILTRELFAHDADAYEYAGWWLTNVSFDLAEFDQMEY